MSTITSSGESIVFIPSEPAPRRVARSRWRIAWRLVAASSAGLVMMVVTDGIRNAVRTFQRERCAAHLKRIGRALLEYEGAQGHFPAAAITSRDGKALLSWRVALLPHLGYRRLYERFHLDEPWDSPHNRALVAEMPPEFACPAGSTVRTGRTSYLVVVGPKADPYSKGTAFEPERGVEIREFTDGTSNSVLVIERDHFVPWTKPDDLKWTPGGPLPRLVSTHQGGAHMLLGDGSVRLLRLTIPPETLLAILTINGGEVVGGG
jgi:prepilin-type processing-associated H-X9-DG protein